MTAPLTPFPDQSALVRNTEYILPGYSSATPPHPLPRFGEEVWDLFAWRSKRNSDRHGYVADFRQLTDPERRLAAKEFLYARLTARLPPYRRLAIGTLGEEFYQLIQFFSYLDAECHGVRLRDLTQSVLDGFLLKCQQGKRGSPVAPAGVANKIIIITKLAAYRDYLSGDYISFTPWEGRSACQVTGYTFQRENTTPRIPEKVLNPLMQWALFYVQVAAHDIVAAQQEKAHFPKNTGTRQKRGDQLTTWISKRRAGHRGIPAHETERHNHAQREQSLPSVNTGLICRMAGLDRWRAEPELTTLLQEAVAELGLEPGGMDTPITGYLPTGQPWRGRFSPHSLQHETRMLVAACYIVITYLSGMRDSEVTSLKRGCHFTETSAEGLKMRHKVRGTTFKGRGRQGKEATWVVIQPVAEAIAVLEQLTDREYLFWPDFSHHDTQEITFASWPLLQQFRDHINRTHQHDGHLPVPDIEGTPWLLNPSQFRRTLAWHIANQPFGVVAGKIQYQHVSVTTFEGYAGQSASGFKSEVEAERRMQQMEDIIERYEEFCQGVQLTGPGAPMITQVFRQVQEDLGDFPGHISDKARVRSMLLHPGRMLYPGILNDCFFDPSVARCLQGTKKDAPLLVQCHPDRCANSCISERHVPQWKRAIAGARGHLGQPRISVLQKQALTTTIADMERVIAPLEGEMHGDKGTNGRQAAAGDGTIAERTSDSD